MKESESAYLRYIILCDPIKTNFSTYTSNISTFGTFCTLDTLIKTSKIYRHYAIFISKDKTFKLLTIVLSTPHPSGDHSSAALL